VGRPYKNSPTVAIVDFLDKATMGEFVAFKNAFMARGIDCVIADITTLKYKNGTLYTKNGLKIDAVYRRAVTSDCLDNLDKITDFLTAYKEKAVCVIGGFKTQVIHDKILFAILHSDKAKAILTSAENDFIKKHIPFTTALVKGRRSDLKLAVGAGIDRPPSQTHALETTKDICYFSTALKNKDKWLIKPKSLYGSIGVEAGIDHTPENWQKLLEYNLDKDFILQEFCVPYKSKNCFVDKKGKLQVHNYNNTTGLYLYGGQLKGFYSRQMKNNTTTTANEGRVACTWLVD